MKYKRKSGVVDAIQWFKNGDHPEDNSKLVCPEKGSITQFEPYLTEGEVVGHYYNREDDYGDCLFCVASIQAHGWMDIGFIVCPGDWIITEKDGRRYPLAPDIFKAEYEEI